jgi:arylsulfatase A-like enzyme
MITRSCTWCLFSFLTPLVVLSAADAPVGTADTASAADRKPNVLMIIVDDMNDWVGCLGGHPDIKTPHIDRLGERGMLFTNGHVTAPVCNPSRVSTLTGKLPSSTGIYDNSVRWHEVLPHLVTIPQHFQAHGYHVVGGGKVHHHTPGNNRLSDWHEYFNQVFDSPAQVHLWSGGRPADFRWPPGFPLNEIPAVAALSRPPQNAQEFDWGPFDRDDLQMGDGQMVAWAQKVLAAPHDKPLFLAAGIYMPHLPWYAPRQYFDMYRPETVTPPPIKEHDLDDIPAGGQRMAAERRGDLELIRREGQYEKVLQAYLACISFADSLVGRLLDALDASPAADNTIVVLWSDHGWHFGEKDHLHKFTLWERSTRIPLIIAAPGVTEPGTRTDQPASTLDLFPTLNQLCGLPPVPDLDGISLVPLLRDPQHVRERPALTTHGPGNHAARSGRWRFIRYADGGEELYDHRHDPHEWTNLADRPEYASVKADLAMWLPKTDAPSVSPGEKRKRKPQTE